MRTMPLIIVVWVLCGVVSAQAYIYGYTNLNVGAEGTHTLV